MATVSYGPVGTDGCTDSAWTILKYNPSLSATLHLFRAVLRRVVQCQGAGQRTAVGMPFTVSVSSEPSQPFTGPNWKLENLTRLRSTGPPVGIMSAPSVPVSSSEELRICTHSHCCWAKWCVRLDDSSFAMPRQHTQQIHMRFDIRATGNARAMCNAGNIRQSHCARHKVCSSSAAQTLAHACVRMISCA